MNSPKNKTLKKIGRNVTYSNTIAHNGSLSFISPRSNSKREKYRQAYLAKSMILRNGFTSAKVDKSIDFDVSSIGTEKINTNWLM